MRSDDKHIKHWNTPFSSILSFFLLFLITSILIYKVRLMFIRQFDPDEFAYLHWAWLMTQGTTPYKDFFFFITPLYPAIHMPLFLLPEGPLIALSGRISVLLWYMGTVFLFFRITKLITKHTLISLLTILIFLTFPMTFDKTIEIRPDMLMMTGILFGIYASLCHRWFWAGFSIGMSLVLFFKAIVLLPLFLPFLWQKTSKKHMLFYGGIGMSLPWMFFFLYLYSNHIVSSAWEAVTKTSMLVSSKAWGFPPLTGFMPYPYVYLTQEGINLPWIINTILPFLALGGCIPLFILLKKQKQLFFMLILFLGTSIASFFCFPRPHIQYFIPFSFIVSYLSALSIWWIYQKFHRLHTLCAVSFISIIGILCMYSFTLQTYDRIRPGNTNEEQLQVLRDVARIIRPEETVYDEVGSYIFRPDGYFICCHHYEQFVDQLDPSLHFLVPNLIKNNTKFLIMDQKGFVFWTPKKDDLQFLITHYLPSHYPKIYTLGQAFQCTQGACVQTTVHGHLMEEKTTTVEVVLQESYAIHMTGDHAWVTIRGIVYRNGDRAIFSPGTYVFTPSPMLSTWSLQLDR